MSWQPRHHLPAKCLGLRLTIAESNSFSLADLASLTAASSLLIHLWIYGLVMDGTSAGNCPFFSLQVTIIQQSHTFDFSGLAKGRVVMCYWGSWSTYRPGDANFETTHIDTNVCTHLIYAFAGISNEYKISVLDPWNDVEVCGGGGKSKPMAVCAFI